MATARARLLEVRCFPAAALAGLCLTGCMGGGLTDLRGDDPETIAETPVTADFPSHPPEDPPFDPITPTSCDPKITVKSHGSALLVRDPAALAGFQLERVLKQLILLSGDGSSTPEQLLQQMFDTENTTAGGVFTDTPHCDDPTNGAFKNAPAINCPRAEGALATSAGLFTPGHPDYFAPVAVVNRFDLTPDSVQSCGEYRIVFAKWSGRSDPNNRVFLIFEGALQSPSPGDLNACRPIAKMWAGLDQVQDPAVLAERLEEFYFTGIAGFMPLVHPNNLGLLGKDDDAYGAPSGQVRLSQRMQAPLEMREFRVRFAPMAGVERLSLVPVTVKNNPLPELFDSSTTTPLALDFRSQFTGMQIQSLGAKSVARVRMAISNNFTTGESAISGPAQANYWGRVTSGGDSAAFLADLNQQINASQVGSACPPEDPLTARSILDRASTQTCAGCHAPTQFLGFERKIGCGLIWPNSLGEVHIDEQGTLSPALTQVLLPRRAKVLATYLQGCDAQAIQENLQPSEKAIPVN
jgi:hypothetical protein